MSDLMTLLRAADPLDPDELASWATSPGRARIRRAVVGTPVASSARPRRSRSRVVAISVAGAALAGGAAAAATSILGEPAPDPVRAHLAELDKGLPADLRYNPDLADARAVAATDSGVLYAADLAGGGYCVEVASAGDQPRGDTCVPNPAAQPIEVIAPLPADDRAPLLVGGRLDGAGLATLTVRYGSGAARPVSLGLDKYFLLEVPAADRAAALADGLRLTGLDAAGQVAARVTVPPLRDDDPRGTAHDRAQPIFVSTVSDGRDLTLVLGIEGRVNVADYATLELSYPDGTAVAVPTAADGRYDFRLPAQRRGDFARDFGVLTARAADGRTLATAPVGSVAAWRQRTGG